MLRGKRSQTASDNRHRPKFGPGCIDRIWVRGVLFADKSVFPIPVLEVVLCASDRDLHCSLTELFFTPQRTSTGPETRTAVSWRQPVSP